MATTIAGLPAENEPEGMTAAVEAVAIVRGYDAGGNIRPYLIRTAGLSPDAAAGLHHVADALYVHMITSGQ